MYYVYSLSNMDKNKQFFWGLTLIHDGNGFDFIDEIMGENPQGK